MKEKKVSVRFSEEEHIQLEKMAKDKNVKVSALLRNAALRGEVRKASDIDVETIKVQCLIMQNYIDILTKTYRRIDKSAFENAMEEIWNVLL